MVRDYQQTAEHELNRVHGDIFECEHCDAMCVKGYEDELDAIECR
jgi:hypothetical protein